MRSDDFEIYMRSQTYELKLFRAVEKFIARLKYVPISKHYEIQKEQQLLLKKNRIAFFMEDKISEKRVRDRFDQSIIKKTDDMIIQFEEILSTTFSCNFTAQEAFHTYVPTKINNLVQLQADILHRAAAFSITGDIEIDNGHSFAYQVSSFFLLYFQKQIIRSQFSVYDQTVRDMKDVFESNEPIDDDIGDINELERRNLNSLLLIDFHMVDYMNSNSDQSNLFLLKKGKQLIDHVTELKANFKDITVIRLKKAYWLDCVMLKPTISLRQKQLNTFLTHSYTPDLLLQSIQDLIDTNDISTIITLYRDLSHMQQQSAHDNKLFIEQITKIIATSQLSDVEARKLLNNFGNAIKKSVEEGEEVVKKQEAQLRIMPQHYLQTREILRHAKIRDTKTKLLYVLNFYRAVQKRITLDLREFAGQEIVSQNVDLKPPQEATYIGKTAKVVTSNLFFKNMKANIDSENFNSRSQSQIHKEQQEDANSYILNHHVVDLKKWRNQKNQHFNQLMLNTCPIIPQFHAKHGEPLEDRGFQQDFTDSKSNSNSHITNKSTYLLTRMDKFSVVYDEIRVIDDFGMHIMFDCSLQDMVALDEQILKIGTYFVKKAEDSLEFEKQGSPLIDRFQLLEDLYSSEHSFHFAKAKLLMLYLDAYEHICDPLEQQRLMQLLTDLMALRPRLDLSCAYFLESYQAEVNCLNSQITLLTEIADYLMSNERKHNKHIKDYLEMSYRQTNDFINKKWTDSNPETIQKDIKQRLTEQGGNQLKDLQSMKEQMEEEKEEKKGGEEVDEFTKILGGKEKSIESLIESTKKDENVEELMASDSNFIKTQEGYPFFIKSGAKDSLSNVKFTEYSNEISVLDFYESMTAIPKVCAAIGNIFDEIIEDFKPSKNLELIAIHTIYIEKVYVEFKKSVAFTEEEIIEYKGSNFIENDLIMYSSDKLMFLIKDMIAHISRAHKRNLNPFFMSKMDLQSITHFQFPDMAKEAMMNQGQLDVNFTRNYLETQLQSAAPQARFFPKLKEDDRKVNVPPMLLVFCNLVEVMRLRESLILTLTETMALQDIYTDLKELANKQQQFRFYTQTPILFQTVDGFTREQLNFFDDGSLTQKDVDLAINEFDPTLRSNINFMNSESVQCMMLDGGVQELRAVSHYQLMHKQILMMAVKANSLMMKQHRKALNEIEMFQEHRIKIAGSIIDYGQLYKQGYAPGQLTVNEEAVGIMKSRIQHQLGSFSEYLFLPILPLKESLRGRIEKKQREMLAQLQTTQMAVTTDHKVKATKQLPPQTVARLNREYRISLLHCYCTQVCKLNLANAHRVTSLEHSSRLKLLMNFFPSSDPKSPLPLILQSNEPRDLLPLHSPFTADICPFDPNSYFISLEDHQLSSLSTIPSVKTLMTLDSLTYDDKSTFEKSIFDQIENLEFNFKYINKNKLHKYKHGHEALLKSLCAYIRQGGEESVKHTVFGRLSSLLSSISECFDFALFQSRLSLSSQAEGLELELAALSNEQFWSSGQEESAQNVKGISERALKRLVEERRKKQQLNDEMVEVAAQIRKVLQAAKYQGEDSRKMCQYLKRYNDKVRMNLLGGMLSVLESFYNQKRNSDSIEKIIEGIRELTRVDLSVPVFTNNGVTLQKYAIDSSARNLDSPIKKDFADFNRSVLGLKLEKEMISPAYLLLNDIFSYPLKVAAKSNYPGQRTMFRQSHHLNSFLLSLSPTEVSYLSTVFISIESNAKDFIRLQNQHNDLSLEAIQSKLVYLGDVAQAKMLYFAMMILLQGRSLPTDAMTFSKVFFTTFKRQIGWKVESQYQKKVSASMQQKKTSNVKPDEAKKARQAKHALDRAIQSDFNAPVQSISVAQQIELTQIKQGRMMNRAMIKVIKREVDVRLIQLAYDAVSTQVSALSKSIEMASLNLDRSIDNWQLFAPTLSDFKHNGQPHLDVSNRISQIQTWLTRLKNRGMDVETLTSGPGIVLNYKDLNECLQTFCTQMISYQEKEMRTRTSGLHLQINQLMNLLYVKDTRIEGLKNKMKLMHENIIRTVNSRIYEKGNALIFELDRGMREVRFYKDHISTFEKEMKDLVKEEFRRNLEEKDLKIDLCKKQAFDQINMLAADFKNLASKEQIEKIDLIKKANKKAQGDLPASKLTSSSNEKGVVNEQTLLKTQEEVIQLQRVINQQRIVWRLKAQTEKLRFQDEIEILKKKLVSNQALWEQLAESDKRTKILQQELIFTQKSLSQCEKIIEKLKEELRLSEHERIRLAQYKQNKGQRLQELEEQVKKMDIGDHININKVIEQLRQKDKKLLYLQGIERSQTEQINKVHEISYKKEQEWKKKLEREIGIKKQALQKLSDLQSELKGFESGQTDTSAVAEIDSQKWKNKCKELFDLCRSLVEENNFLIEKLKSKDTSLNQDSNQILPISANYKNYLENPLISRTGESRTGIGLQSKSLQSRGATRNKDLDFRNLENVSPLQQVSTNLSQTNMFYNPSSTMYSQSFLLPNITKNLLKKEVQEGSLSQPYRAGYMDLELYNSKNVTSLQHLLEPPPQSHITSIDQQDENIQGNTRSSEYTEPEQAYNLNIPLVKSAGGGQRNLLSIKPIMQTNAQSGMNSVLRNAANLLSMKQIQMTKSTSQNELPASHYNNKGQYEDAYHSSERVVTSTQAHSASLGAAYKSAHKSSHRDMLNSFYTNQRRGTELGQSPIGDISGLKLRGSKIQKKK